MIGIGDIIEARVYKVEPYGVFLRHAGVVFFVHLPELSWTDRRPANGRDLLNRLLRVQVLARHSEKDQWIASARKSQPETNPFLEIANLPNGAIVSGKIVYETNDTIFICLENGAEGFIERSEVSHEIRVGNMVEVIVVMVNAKQGKLQLRLKE